MYNTPLGHNTDRDPMGLGQYNSLGKYCEPHTASPVFLILLCYLLCEITFINKHTSVYSYTKYTCILGFPFKKSLRIALLAYQTVGTTRSPVTVIHLRKKHFSLPETERVNTKEYRKQTDSIAANRCIHVGVVK